MEHGLITAFRSSAVAIGFREQKDQTETYCDFGVADVGVAAAAATTVPRIESKWARWRDCTKAISAMSSAPPPPVLASAMCFSDPC